ncbi:hypothetical protein QL093DRAFT_2527328 [Fusarium oxysporum]|nr:hypothetical protein QL093DRAFT_2527328 [Fusarium oxysporum]
MSEVNYSNRAGFRITQYSRIPSANKGKIGELLCPFSSDKIYNYYQVNLSSRWYNMPRYKSFVCDFFSEITYQSPMLLSYSNICTAKLGRASIKRKRDWVAHIVDIRGGKRGKEYQENELVASNHLGVIDVRDVDRVVPLKVLRKTRNDKRSQRFIWKDFFDCMHGSIIENYAR